MLRDGCADDDLALSFARGKDARRLANRSSGTSGPGLARRVVAETIGTALSLSLASARLAVYRRVRDEMRARL